MTAKKNTPKTSQENQWVPDLERIFYVSKGQVFIGGVPQPADVVQELKGEAAGISRLTLISLLGNTIANEAARYALEEIKQGESAEVRSSKLAFAQALAVWNKHVWTNLALLAKL